MNCVFRLLVAGGIGLLAGCSPREPGPPAAPVRDEMALRREFLFGPRAAATDIAWQPSGLGIRLLAPGDGVSPQPTDRVRVHYVGTLKDGRVIDDTRAHGQPADLRLSRVIPGWAEGIAALKPGGRAELFVPPSLGYGNMGVGNIPAGSGLIFDVELLAVNPETGSKPPTGPEVSVRPDARP